MPVNTSISPYYDDYNEEKGYYRVLFRPGAAVQARELTQSQTILQNQIKRVGDYLFTDGDKVSGAKPSVNINARTVRLSENDIPNLNLFLNKFVTINEDNAPIGKVEFVFQKDDPNIGDPPSIVINLLRYNSENDGMFSENSTLLFYNDYTSAINRSTTEINATVLQDSNKNSTSTLSSFSKLVTLANPNPNIKVGDRLVHPNITKKLYVTKLTDSVTLEINEVPEVNISAELVTYSTKGTSPTIILTQDNSVFYKDGFFVNSNLQKIVPDKDTAYPTRLVGYFAEQNIVTSSDDNSLLDPALGSSNYFATGADRLQITLELSSLELQRVTAAGTLEDNKPESVEDFIPLIKFNKGEIEYIKDITLGGQISKTIAERTYDESGSYVVDPFKVIPIETPESDSFLRFNIMTGKAYVGGNQVKTIGPTEIAIPKNTGILTTDSYNINTTYGNYVKVSDISGGLIKTNQFEAADGFLELHNTANPTSNASRVGLIGYKGLEFDSYDGEEIVYKLFYNYYEFEKDSPDTLEDWGRKYNLTSSQLNKAQLLADILYLSNDLLGNTFDLGQTNFYGLYRDPDTTGLYYWLTEYEKSGDNLELTKKNFAIAARDADDNFDEVRVLTNSKSYAPGDNGFFYDGKPSAKQVRSIVGVANERTQHGTSATYASPFFYSKISSAGINNQGELILFDERPTNSLIFPINKEYVKDISNLSTQYNRVYETVTFSNGIYSRTVSSPENFPFGDGNVPLATARSNFILLIKTGQTAGVPYGIWEFNQGTVTVSGSSTVLSIDLGDSSFNGTADLLLPIENDTLTSRIKTLQENKATILNIQLKDYPYDIGYADIYSYQGIYKLANVSAYKGLYSEITTYNYGEVVISNGAAYTCEKYGSNLSLSNSENWLPVPPEDLNYYILDNGQRDDYYDHGYITYRAELNSVPGNVLVTYSYFSHSGDGPCSVNSYDSSLYSYIPVYRSVVNSQEYILRDCLDFRPRRQDSTIYQNYDPAIVPISTFNTEATVKNYLGRSDRLYVSGLLQNFESPFNKFFVDQGIASINPQTPENKSDISKLSIAILDIPPYAFSAFDVKITYDDNKRFTMRDIGKIEDLVIKLDKAVKIQAMELSILKSTILNENTGEVLVKSGVLIEDFSNLDKADIIPGYFSCVIDEEDKECMPGLNAYNVNLDLVPDTDVAFIDDMITMKYGEEILASQLEINSFVNVNPGAIDDGIGRAIPSKKNSLVINLLLAGGLFLATRYAVKAAASYFTGTTVATSSLSTASISSTLGQVASYAEQALGIAWNTARELGSSFLDSIGTIDSVTKFFSEATTGVMNVGKVVYQAFQRGFNSVLDFFGVGSSATSATTTAASSAGLTSGTFAAGSYATGIGISAGYIQYGLNQMGAALGNILNQSIGTTLQGVGAGLVSVATGIVSGALTIAATAANSVAVALGFQPIFTAAVGQTLGTTIASNVAAFAQGGIIPGVAVVVAAAAIIYVGSKVVKKVWKAIKKLFSDRNMKENIVFERRLTNGLNLYSFEYKKEFKDIAGHGRFFGCMADEVEKIYPKAVTIENNGYKSVDYSRIGT